MLVTWRNPKAAQLRYCAKVALAAAAAYALTLGVRHEYALFTVLSATLVMGTSVGEDLNTSLNRVRGTLAAVIVGTAVGSALGLSIGSLALAVAALALLCAGFALGTPALRVGISMVLVVMFMHTGDAIHYGAWRLLNTVLGVCIGMAVSRYVWPVRGRDEIAAAMRRALAAIAAILDAVARSATAEALQPLQLELLDTLTALRTARKNAKLEQQITHETDVLSVHTKCAVRAAIAALETSVRFDEVAGGLRAEALQALQQVVAAVAAQAADLATGGREFADRHALASREAAHPDINPEARALVLAFLRELEWIRSSLQTIHDAPRQAVAVK